MKQEKELSLLGKFTMAYTEAVWTGTQRGLDKVYLRKKIASRVKELRLANKKTQEEISAAIDTNVLTYRGYENIKSDIPTLLLIRLADLYHVSMDYITCRTDDMKGMYSDEAEPESEEIKARLAKLEAAISKMDTKAQ